MRDVGQAEVRRSPTAAQRAYVSLRGQILAGTFQVGERLREEDVAEVLGVSRTPVREAMRRLDAEGLLDLSDHRGARVAGWTDQDREEIFLVRVNLEAQAARLAARDASPALLAALTLAAQEMEDEVAADHPDRMDRISDSNQRFHQTLSAAGGNKRLASVLASVVNRGLVSRTFHEYRPDQLARSCRHHRELIEACASHDPDWAEAIMKAHLYASRHAIHATRLDGGE